MTLIPLAVELTKVADIQDLGFSQAFETIYATLESLRNEEDEKTEIFSPAIPVIEEKKRKQRRVTCVLCGQKFRRLVGKHLSRVHGITIREYRELKVQPGLISSGKEQSTNHAEV